MRRVLIALLPCLFGAVYYFGWRCAAMVLVSAAVAFLTEWLFCRTRHEPVYMFLVSAAPPSSSAWPPGPLHASTPTADSPSNKPSWTPST